MNSIFWLQVVISFVIGGGIISLLSYGAEKAPRNIKGLIMALPSTMLVSFVFIANINGTQSLVESIPGIPYALVGSILYVLIYFLSAKALEAFQLSITFKIFLTWLIASLCWIIFPIMSTYFPHENVWFSFTIFLIAVALFQPLFIWISNKHLSNHGPLKITKSEILFRVCFAGTIVALSVIISKTCGSYWGAVIGGSYPASFGSQLMIFQRKYPASFLVSAIRSIPLGLIPLNIFVITASYSYLSYGIWIGTVISLLTCFLAAWGVRKISQKILQK